MGRSDKNNMRNEGDEGLTNQRIRRDYSWQAELNGIKLNFGVRVW